MNSRICCSTKEMKPLILRGLGTAMVTPFTDGRLDLACYRALVRRQVEAGVDFLVPLGSTAETPCLEEEEKVAIAKATRELAGRLPVVVGAGTNSLTATIRNIKTLEPCGADAYLVVVPYYNKPMQEGMYQYFKAVAESTSKGIVLYNVPGRTGANMTAETTLRLAEIPNIIAIKEASGDMGQIMEIVRNAPEGFSVLSGNDSDTRELMEGGGQGLISVVSNIAPGLVAEMVHDFLNHENRAGEELDKALAPLGNACFVESNPIPVKGGLSVMGLCRNELRLPLTPAEPSTVGLMREIIAKLGIHD